MVDLITPDLAAISDDEFARYAQREAAAAMGEWLIAADALRRPVMSLQAWELGAMAGAAVARYMVLVSERLAMGGNLTRQQKELFLA